MILQANSISTGLRIAPAPAWSGAFARDTADVDGVWRELRNEVVVINAEGKKLETDLMYWDMKKEIVYSDRYSRLTSGDQIIEGNKGFKSDQSLKNPVFNKITGVVEIENKP